METYRVAGVAGLLGATYQELTGIGHCDVLLKQPESRRVAEAVTTWLGSVRP